MTITNPLDLPEIREALILFLTTSDLARCARVCQDWYASFLPYLWSTIDIHTEQSKQPTLEALQRHKDHVRHLHYQSEVPTDHRSIHFPALETLHFLRAVSRDNEMVGNHASLTNVKLFGAYTRTFWNPQAALPNLTSLKLIRVDVRLQDRNVVWSLFPQLETLEVRGSSMMGIPQSATGNWKMKDLTLGWLERFIPKEQLRCIKMCPRLRRLAWVLSCCPERHPVEEFTQCITAKTWPDLEELYIPLFRATDRQIALMISGMRHVHGLSVTCTEPFALVKNLLRPQFHCLRKWETASIFAEDTGFLMEILKSCPQLESFKIGTVQVHDLVEDSTPWACERSLRQLQVCIKASDTVGETEQRMFERLSRLRNLELLSLSSGMLLHGLGLCLGSGLEQLTTLTRLVELDFINTVQKMTMKDVEWMIEHWKSLKDVRGRLNSEDEAECQRMRARFQEAGITALQ